MEPLRAFLLKLGVSQDKKVIITPFQEILDDSVIYATDIKVLVIRKEK